MISRRGCSPAATGSGATTLILIAMILMVPHLARAGDLEDCNGTVADKIEPACTAVIADATRPADDRAKAYVNRGRLYISRSKFDLALNDAEAALELNAQFVPALI
jgi:hypothetical protein